MVINLVVDLLYYAVDPRLRRRAARMMRAAERASHRAWRQRSALYSFRRSPVAVISALVALILLVAGASSRRCSRRTTRSTSPASSLMDSFKPPAFMADADWSNLLGTDDQGRDVLSAHHVRHAHQLARRAAVGVCSRSSSGSASGCWPAIVGGAVDALLMRIADVQLTFPSILIALLVDGVVSAALPRDDARARCRSMSSSSPSASASGRNFARTVRGSTLVERNKDYVMAARVIGVAVVAHHADAMCCRTCSGPVLVIATLNLGLGDHHRGDAVVPRRRPAADPAVARHADPDRQRLPVLRRVVGRRLSRRSRWC